MDEEQYIVPVYFRRMNHFATDNLKGFVFAVRECHCHFIVFRLCVAHISFYSGYGFLEGP